MTNRKIEYWVIPPEADAEFVAQMEEVLKTYAWPYNPKRPVLCMNEQPQESLAGRRFGDVRSLGAETKGWSFDVNGAQRGVDWPMKIGDARCKLASVYPRIRL